VFPPHLYGRAVLMRCLLAGNVPAPDADGIPAPTAPECRGARHAATHPRLHRGSVRCLTTRRADPWHVRRGVGAARRRRHCARGRVRRGLPAHRVYAEALARVEAAPTPIADGWQARIQAGIQRRAAGVYLYSSLPDEVARRALLTPCHDVAAQVRASLAARPGGAPARPAAGPADGRLPRPGVTTPPSHYTFEDNRTALCTTGL